MKRLGGIIESILIKALIREGWELTTPRHLTHLSGADINYDGEKITATRADGTKKDCGDSLNEAIRFVKGISK
jgi:hypothetical protein